LTNGYSLLLYKSERWTEALSIIATRRNTELNWGIIQREDVAQCIQLKRWNEENRKPPVGRTGAKKQPPKDMFLFAYFIPSEWWVRLLGACWCCRVAKTENLLEILWGLTSRFKETTTASGNKLYPNQKPPNCLYLINFIKKCSFPL
jgi:hypothetical protein